MLAAAVDERNEVEEILHKFQLRKAIYICAWMRRFAHQRDESPEPALQIGRFKRVVTPSEFVWR